EAAEMAYAPYSQFKVGAALYQGKGLTTGSNQENAAYPSGLCAERVALFSAKSKSDQAIEAIAVVAVNDQEKVADALPCGSCRQVLLEYADQQESPIRVIMRTASGEFIIVPDARDLLPFNFSSSALS
ncbi:MAG: cytidine deaminase, partial [Cyclobacteriaceae bacterium]|nr:cytidine deaminase [Cyclobacteriaceae bacterium HetDA_MAG_MS6]